VDGAWDGIDADLAGLPDPGERIDATDPGTAPDADDPGAPEDPASSYTDEGICEVLSRAAASGRLPRRLAGRIRLHRDVDLPLGLNAQEVDGTIDNRILGTHQAIDRTTAVRRWPIEAMEARGAQADRGLQLPFPVAVRRHSQNAPTSPSLQIHHKTVNIQP